MFFQVPIILYVLVLYYIIWCQKLYFITFISCTKLLTHSLSYDVDLTYVYLTITICHFWLMIAFIFDVCITASYQDRHIYNLYIPHWLFS